MSKKILILGAGLVVKPIVDYLVKHGYQLTVADRIFEKAEKLSKLHDAVNAIELDIMDENRLSGLIREHSLTVSLLPATMHVSVAKKCVEYKKPMVTTSYISPQMKELNDAAKEAGIIILNEIGVDPGIDHMSAMKIIHHVENNGGKITGFKSYCGGLPAPKNNSNPWGYKFSWSPQAVLRAAGNSGKYMLDGEIIDVPGKELFSHYHLVDVPGCATFEAYVNRDALSYIDLYNLKHVKTMYRGTFRNISHCDTWYCLAQLNFFDNEVVHENLTGTVKDFIKVHLLKKPDCNCTDIRPAVAKFLNISDNNIVIKKFEWLGFFDNTPIPVQSGTAMDILTALMDERLPYYEGEVDMIAMHHIFTAEYPDKTQKITSTMVDYGIENGDSSMSRTVSLPAAISVRMILEDKIKLTGVHLPVMPEIYEPVLNELETMNIKLEEKFF